jgi:putative hydrolase of the HAD superfamily
MTTILFDLFGTLVTYDPSRTAQGYPRATAILERAGCTLGHDAWLAVWATVSEDLDRRADETGVEFAMAEAFRAFAPAVGVAADHPELEAEFLRCYLEEWSAPVRVVPGAAAMLGRLAAAGHRNVLVSNTHDADLVRGQLDAFGLLPHLDAVVTSVELGLRKPRPEIYAAALEPFGVLAADALFVGDTYGPDYAGPTAVGIDAYLIVADGVALPAGLPADRRLSSVLAIEDVVGA